VRLFPAVSNVDLITLIWYWNIQSRIKYMFRCQGSVKIHKHTFLFSAIVSAVAMEPTLIYLIAYIIVDLFMSSC